MFTSNGTLYVAHGPQGPICIQGKMANRHGLIAGATGTGKTITLQVLAETFSAAGVPCFMADMKGDLSGISKTGGRNKFIDARCTEFGLDNPPFGPCPTRFFDVFGEQGHPLRTTISAMGPMMLSRLLNLTEVQAGVLQIVFKVADDQGLLLIDLKDLRMMLDYVATNAKSFSAAYGNVSTASVGAIQRALLTLEGEGADKFFGEPSFNVMDFLQSEGGRGVMNVLAADKLMLNPKLYSTFLLWMLSELYTDLPEIGDQALPKFVFFFDEAHTLFDETPKALVDKIEQVVRLIRSKGVGVYFVTQNPSDIPDSILGQLGNRVQHALRAYTPKDMKGVKAAAASFRANPSFSTEDAIMELGTGEALVSFLDEKGIPAMVERAKILFPMSSIGAISPDERRSMIQSSRLYGIYDRYFDRESAYEILTQQKQTELKKQQQEQEAIALEKEREAMAKAEREAEKRAAGTRSRTSAPAARRQTTRQSPLEKAIGAAASSVGRQIGNQIVRSLLGSILRK